MRTKIFYKEKMKTEHKIINGDCIEELKKLQEGSVDLIVTDPPFNIGKKYNSYADNKSKFLCG